MFKEAKNYLRDNPKGYWFKRKLYGWGWVPVKWQGWLVTFLFFLYVLWVAVSLNKNPNSTQLTWFFIKLIAGTVLLILVCYATGESPRWQWGPPTNEKKK